MIFQRDRGGPHLHLAPVLSNIVLMNIKMIGLDLDQTLLDSKKQVPEENVKAIREALAAGIEVLPVTGRPVNAVPAPIMNCADFHYVIAAGGAYCADRKNGKVLFTVFIPEETVVGAVTDLRKAGFIVTIFSDGNGYLDEKEIETAISYAPTPGAKEYLRTMRVRVPDIDEVLRRCSKTVDKITISLPWKDGVMQRKEEAAAVLAPYADDLNIMFGTEVTVEIQAKDADKSFAIVRLGEILGIAPDEIMVCGDSENDLGMIRAVGWGVAMENADEEVKAAARFVTKSNEEAGVAYAIRKLVLGEDI